MFLCNRLAATHKKVRIYGQTWTLIFLIRKIIVSWKPVNSEKVYKIFGKIDESNKYPWFLEDMFKDISKMESISNYVRCHALQNNKICELMFF